MNWSIIRNFGKVKYFNISYVVLIIVPLLANTLHVINKKFSYDLDVPPMVKSLYIASILYAIGIAIYQYRCPAIIKDYENKQAFIKDNIEIFMNKAPDLKLNIVLTNLNRDTQMESYNEVVSLYAKSKQEQSAFETAKLESQLNDKLNFLYKGTVQSYLEKQFDADNTREPVSYWLSGIFYMAGTLIVIILLIMRTLIVSNN